MKIFTTISIEPGAHMSQTPLRLSIVNQVGTNQDLQNIKKLFGRFSSTTGLGGLRNKIMKLAHALDIAISVIRSFYDFGSSALLNQ